MKRRTRRVNHTRRIRIELQRCALRVSARDHAVLVSARVDLSELILEPDAKVFLDAVSYTHLTLPTIYSV